MKRLLFIFFEIFRQVLLYTEITIGRDRGGAARVLFFICLMQTWLTYMRLMPRYLFRAKSSPSPRQKEFFFSWGDSISIRNAHYLLCSTVLR